MNVGLGLENRKMGVTKFIVDSNLGLDKKMVLVVGPTKTIDNGMINTDCPRTI